CDRSGSDERVDAARVARAREILLEAIGARAGVRRAARLHERFDRDDLALLHERAAREATRVTGAERERLGGTRTERVLRVLEELHLGLRSDLFRPHEGVGPLHARTWRGRL